MSSFSNECRKTNQVTTPANHNRQTLAMNQSEIEQACNRVQAQDNARTDKLVFKKQY